MAYDEGLSERVREALAEAGDVSERKMFGGLAFMVAGHMTCGVLEDRLMVRVGPDAYDEALSEPHAHPMDFTGRPMKGMVYVAPEGLTEDAALRVWVERGLRFAGSLPPKPVG
jgi:TfoX/Sxy family transcriptional regulator of competence genes